MTERTASEASVPENVPLEDWPLRPWLLAAIGAVAGLAAYLLLDGFTAEAWRAALAAFAFFSALAAGFVLRPQRLPEAAAFAVGLGVVMGGIAYLVVKSGDSRAGEEFAFAAGVFFSVLAVPLFQSDFHHKRWSTPYAETHFHVWTDAVSAGGAFLFMVLSWALLWLLHGLFSLIGIEVIGDLIETGWFSAMFVGVTFGAALGVLRNQLGIIGTLQRVVMLVFSLLAVPFALAIMIFLVILLFSGGSALWEATDSATPVLLTCAVGCFILCNSVVRDDDAQRSSSVVMQSAALVLAFCIFPLTVFAAVSMGIRIDQHGLSPERIWALVAIIIACSYGLAYWVGLARGRMAGWSEYVRRANLHLAAVTCVVALLLSLPLFDLGKISAKSQVARLDAGEVSLEDFDFAALRWDFGDAGREVLAQLVGRGGDVARLAQAAQLQEDRYWHDGLLDLDKEFSGQIVVKPAGTAIPESLRALIMTPALSPCSADSICRVFLFDRNQEAVVINDHCAAPNILENQRADPNVECSIDVNGLKLVDGEWLPINLPRINETMSREDEVASLRREREAIKNGDIRIGPSERRQIYIGDKPVLEPFE